MIYIGAQNYRHFIEWCRQTETNPREVRYVESPQRLMGIDPNTFEFIAYETFPYHPQAHEILDRVNWLRSMKQKDE